MANHHDIAHQDSNRDERSEGNDDKRRASLMNNKYVTNHHDLHQDSNQDEGPSGYEDMRRTNLMKRDNAMKKTYDISDVGR